ncbi:MAG: histidine kinase, partial [Flavobacteriales bacterium]|nr:histidine kinase [Flavobacteriales bacterium]
MKQKFRSGRYGELIFQVLLHVIVFIFYTHDRRDPSVQLYEVFFFLNYAVAAAIINYILLPRYLYKGHLLKFVVFLCLLIGLVIFIEEGVIEQIFFPATRGANFPGVFLNLLSAMPTITILSGFKFAWDALEKQREMQRLKDSVKESELQFLKSQINPHFLFNNLNNLYAHAIERSAKTPEIILELSAVLRYMLYDCREDFVLLSKEIEQMRNYINLNELQIEGRGKVVFDAEEIDAQLEIAPLILMVFVENAFKHSASSQRQGIDIKISLKAMEKGRLNFRCSNSFHSESNIQNLD